jgi:hypothetical protein
VSQLRQMDRIEHRRIHTTAWERCLEEDCQCHSTRYGVLTQDSPGVVGDSALSSFNCIFETCKPSTCEQRMQSTASMSIAEACAPGHKFAGAELDTSNLLSNGSLSRFAQPRERGPPLNPDAQNPTQDLIHTSCMPGTLYVRKQCSHATTLVTTPLQQNLAGWCFGYARSIASILLLPPITLLHDLHLCDTQNDTST